MELSAKRSAHGDMVPSLSLGFWIIMTMPIQFDHAFCGDPGEACSREWLETNAIGGFACSTLIGLNTRRYHALLVAATKPPVGRMVLLSKVEETIVLADQRFELSANQYKDVIH